MEIEYLAAIAKVAAGDYSALRTNPDVPSEAEKIIETLGKLPHNKFRNRKEILVPGFDDGVLVQELGFGSSFAVREAFVKRFAWAIPNEEAFTELAKHGPLVECGAGAGYWAHELHKRGVDVLAYDSSPYKNLWCSGDKWALVTPGDESIASIHADRTLFLCWPPYDEVMALRALRYHASAGGTKIAYVGEGHGGCTGDDGFHEALENEYNEISYVEIPRWAGIRDYLWIYERKA